MFAVLQIPDFPLQALLRFNPALRGEAVALLEGNGRRARISLATPAARNVSPGMTAAQALGECPSLQLVAPSLIGEREAGAILLVAGWAIAPRVEATDPGVVTIDLTGVNLPRLRTHLAEHSSRFQAEGLSLRIGVAENPLLARYAAYHADSICWVDDSRAFLTPLSIELLGPTELERRLLHDLGLRTLGSITAFPRAAFVNRMGARGDELWAKAAGQYVRPIQPVPPPQRHLAQIDLEECVESLDPLLFLLRRFCERLAAEVGQFGGGTARLSLILKLDNDEQLGRDFDLPEPTSNPDLLFAVLENHLASLSTDAPIAGLSLEAFPTRRLQTQEGLFDIGLRDAPMFYATLGRLAAIVGSENVGTPQRKDTHRPDSFQLMPPAAFIPERRAPAAPSATGPLLRRLRPPAPATVELTAAAPSFLHSGLVQGEVTVLRRPVRTNGDWWSSGWAREEWDVQIGPGLYRLLHDPTGWFVEGIYD